MTQITKIRTSKNSLRKSGKFNYWSAEQVLEDLPNFNNSEFVNRNLKYLLTKAQDHNVTVYAEKGLFYRLVFPAKNILPRESLREGNEVIVITQNQLKVLEINIVRLN
jgi:hypothetical protein